MESKHKNPGHIKVAKLQIAWGRYCFDSSALMGGDGKRCRGESQSRNARSGTRSIG